MRSFKLRYREETERGLLVYFPLLVEQSKSKRAVT